MSSDYLQKGTQLIISQSNLYLQVKVCILSIIWHHDKAVKLVHITKTEFVSSYLWYLGPHQFSTSASYKWEISVQIIHRECITCFCVCSIHNSDFHWLNTHRGGWWFFCTSSQTLHYKHNDQRGLKYTKLSSIKSLQREDCAQLWRLSLIHTQTELCSIFKPQLLNTNNHHIHQHQHLKVLLTLRIVCKVQLKAK